MHYIKLWKHQIDELFKIFQSNLILFFFSICTSLSDISDVLFLTSFDVLSGYFYVSLNLVTGPTVKFSKSMILTQPFFRRICKFFNLIFL